MSPQIRIEDEEIYLRELNENDASEEYCSWLNDPVTNQYIVTRKATVEGLRKYIREKKNSTTCLFFGIFDNKTKKHIGNAKLEPIDFKKKTADLGILIGEKDYWGRGICTRCVKLLVKYAFEQLDINRVQLEVFPKNIAAIKCYKKVGLKIETIEEGGFKIGSNSYDKIIMAIER